MCKASYQETKGSFSSLSRLFLLEISVPKTWALGVSEERSGIQDTQWKPSANLPCFQQNYLITGQNQSDKGHI